MEVRPATERWTLALLSSLEEPVRADLISLTHAGFVLQAAARADGSKLTAAQAFVMVVHALLGQDEYRNSVASRLPVYNVMGEHPELLTGNTVKGKPSQRDIHLVRVIPGRWTAYECARLAVGLGVHRRGIAAAFNLSHACFSGAVTPPLDADQEVAELLTRLHAVARGPAGARREP